MSEKRDVNRILRKIEEKCLDKEYLKNKGFIISSLPNEGTCYVSDFTAVSDNIKVEHSRHRDCPYHLIFHTNYNEFHSFKSEDELLNNMYIRFQDENELIEFLRDFPKWIFKDSKTDEKRLQALAKEVFQNHETDEWSMITDHEECPLSVTEVKFSNYLVVIDEIQPRVYEENKEIKDEDKKRSVLTGLLKMIN